MKIYQELINELDIKNELTCFKCNNLVKHPFECFNCQKILCKKCINIKQKCCDNPLIKKCKFLQNFIENLHKIKKPKEKNLNKNNINVNYDDLIKEINVKIQKQENEKIKLNEIYENLKENENILVLKIKSLDKNDYYDNKNDIKQIIKEYELKNKMLQNKIELLKKENENYFYNI